ncbi:MAG: Rieske 2Fe-2S domain-containing protein [Candidatus Competibacteraceae bacterium]|uniref:Rieske (2Fe-2S) protein n=1 Tax=Candidatus Contendobacter odensis Run_B_J11 TaxID=1400861 RepID=A0A7U7J660_9GAMM|nr:Rieske 2Fe-2S domain-containing protein [Candidatus Contendobacter odensis]MBK8537160.1 Rieske 2Fe-2S domain-containing protein [Candidatus Competibacteraceae bacterium]MBK8754377.1 Rieske 2Fe-2S domain-containing protein [Candidatus Competibacteraceae bacterium]CDH47267.1 putative Rieske (2Fe-2S) protein [Candidatus Contendobacter odensis Run_B_J11]
MSTALGQSLHQPEEQILCRLDDLPEGQSKGFALDPAARYADILVVRTPAGIYAYRNRCPHTFAPMEWEPDEFLDLTGTVIQCGIHGALFRIEDGYCVSGPCVRQSLQRIAVTVREGWLVALESLGRSHD